MVKEVLFEDQRWNYVEVAFLVTVLIGPSKKTLLIRQYQHFCVYLLLDQLIFYGAPAFPYPGICHLR